MGSRARRSAIAVVAVVSSLIGSTASTSSATTAPGAGAQVVRAHEAAELRAFLRRATGVHRTRAQYGDFALHRNDASGTFCLRNGYLDRYGDGGLVDANGYAIGYDCSTQTWAVIASDPAGLNSADLGSFGMLVDRDQDSATGCNGADVAVAVAYDSDSAQFVAGAINTPDCDTNDWTVRPESVSVGFPDADTIGLAFPNSVIDAGTFKWALALADSANVIDNMPDAGWKTATTPGAEPSPPPTAVHAIAADGTVAVTFAPPLGGGSGVTSYDVTLQPSGQTQNVAGTSSPVMFTGLDDKTGYRASVVAHNAGGTSRATNSNTVVPTGVGPQGTNPFHNGPSISVNGTYKALAGDFNGDGHSDVLWYAPGRAHDVLWLGTASGGYAHGWAVSISGTYEPVVGDFNGDGNADVLWYAPGPAADYLWLGGASAFTTAARLTVAGTYRALVGDFNGDGNADVFWYAAGVRPDSIWLGTAHGFVAAAAINVRGSYDPSVGDFNGDGYADVLWYAPGTAGDSVWLGGRNGFAGNARISVNGRYQDIVGDFNADGYSDVLWYAPGSGRDYLWPGSATGFGAAAVLTINGNYQGLSGDINGDGRSDVVWYAPGTAHDTIWLGGA